MKLRTPMSYESYEGRSISDLMHISVFLYIGILDYWIIGLELSKAQSTRNPTLSVRNLSTSVKIYTIRFVYATLMFHSFTWKKIHTQSTRNPTLSVLRNLDQRENSYDFVNIFTWKKIHTCSICSIACSLAYCQWSIIQLGDASMRCGILLRRPHIACPTGSESESSSQQRCSDNLKEALTVLTIQFLACDSLQVNWSTDADI